MIEPTKYVLCSTNCKYPAFTAEEVLALLQYAIDNKSLEGINSDAGFITKLKEMNGNKAVKLWLGTQAEYAALETKETDTLYIFTDDSTSADLEAAFTEANSKAEQALKDASAVEKRVTNIEDGDTTVGKAEKLSTSGSLAGVAVQVDHEVKQTYPSNILSITTNVLGGLTSFYEGGATKLTEAGIYLVQCYEKLNSGTYNMVSTMILAWDGEHVGVSSLGYLPNQAVTTPKTLYLAVGTDGSLSCYLWDDEVVPLGSNSIIGDYDLTFKIFKIGETPLLV